MLFLFFPELKIISTKDYLIIFNFLVTVDVEYHVTFRWTSQRKYILEIKK